MAVRTRFLAWSAEQQARYRTDLPDVDHTAIVALLLESMQEQNAAALARKEARGRLTLRLQNRIMKCSCH